MGESKCFAGTSEESKKAPSGKREPRERSELLPHQSVTVAVQVKVSVAADLKAALRIAFRIKPDELEPVCGHIGKK